MNEEVIQEINGLHQTSLSYRAWSFHAFCNWSLLAIGNYPRQTIVVCYCDQLIHHLPFYSASMGNFPWGCPLKTSNIQTSGDPQALTSNHLEHDWNNTGKHFMSVQVTKPCSLSARRGIEASNIIIPHYGWQIASIVSPKAFPIVKVISEAPVHKAANGIGNTNNASAFMNIQL